MVEDILRIWKLAHTPCATNIERGWGGLLSALGSTLNAPTRFITLAGRTGPHRAVNGGWRPLYRVGHPPSTDGEGSDHSTWSSSSAQRYSEVLTAAMVTSAGRTRVVRHSSLPEQGDRKNTRLYLAHRRHRDRLMGGLPLSPTVELHVGLDRTVSQACFTDRDVQLLEQILPALRQMGRWLALSKGVLPHGKRLTEDEQRVLVELLRGITQNEGADRLEMSPTAFRHRSKSLYKKLGVAGRNELAALWLETASSGTHLPGRRLGTG